MKKKGNISIKAKLLGIIIPVVIAIILILVFTAYHVSSGIIESYSKNLLESSVNSQASKIEAWLEDFLDEGFGSLDDESLEQAMRVLAGLTEGDRLVGIISHVGALKDRIDRQVVVRKARTGGSTVELIV